MRLRDEAPGNRGCPRRSDVCVTCQVSHAKLSKITLGEQILVTRLPVQVLNFGWKPDRLSGLSGLVRWTRPPETGDALDVLMFVSHAKCHMPS
jgi:hypothetical protein